MYFKMFDPQGSLVDEGAGKVKFVAGALTVVPNMGQPLTIQSAAIEAIEEPAPFSVGVRLSDGTVVELSQLGQMRTQLLSELNEVRHDDAKKTLLLVGIGKPDKFRGAVNGRECEVFLYDDALVAMGSSGEPLQLLYSFVESIDTTPSEYHVTLRVKGDEPVTLERFANRTGELIKLLQSKVSEASIRTSAFLSSLLPGLGPVQTRKISGLLRDGIAGKVSDLNSIDPTIFTVLLDVATAPSLKDLASSLVRCGDVRLGFKQRRSVQRKAKGTESWYDHTHKAIDDHGGVPSAPGGFGGFMMASMLQGGVGSGAGYGFAGAFGQGGSALAYEMLGMSMRMGGRESMGMFPGTNQSSHEVAQRSVTPLNPLIAAHTDYSALRVNGVRPAILSFLLVANASKIFYCSLNDAEDPIVVFDASSIDVTSLNRALALIDFEVDVLSEDMESAASPFRVALEKLSSLSQLHQAFQEAIPADDTTGVLKEMLKGNSNVEEISTEK